MIFVENFLKSYSAKERQTIERRRIFVIHYFMYQMSGLIFSTDTNWQSFAKIGEWDEETDVEDSPKGFIEILQNEWEIKR